MAKKIDEKSIIDLELKKIEDKVNEFQSYLEDNSITKVKPLEHNENDNYQDKLHKEILVQIKMQDALFSWLPLLQKLKELDSEKEVSTRGDVPINGLFKSKRNN